MNLRPNDQENDRTVAMRVSSFRLLWLSTTRVDSRQGLIPHLSISVPVKLARVVIGKPYGEFLHLNSPSLAATLHVGNSEIGRGPCRESMVGLINEQGSFRDPGTWIPFPG